MATTDYNTTLATPTGLINSTFAPSAANIAAPTGSVAAATGSTAAAPASVTSGNVVGQGYDAVGGTASLQAPAATYTGAQTTGAQWGVEPDQTVQSQIQRIIAENSPLMQQAETRALQQANKRGLMNSSMAVGAGQSALYDVAAPIASADAATYARAGEFNAGAQQQANLSNQASTNTANQFNAGSINNVNSQNSQLETNVSLSNAASSNKAAEFSASAANEASRANVENGLKAGMFNSQQAAEIAKFNAELLTNVNLANVKDANQMQQFLLDQQLKANVINQDQFNRMSQFNAQAANEIARFNATLDADIAKFNASESNDLTKLGMDAQTKLEMANIEANYNVLMQSSASAADLYKQMVLNASNILLNKDMDEAAKSTAIKNQIALLNSGMGVVGQITNLDMGDLLTFDVPGVDGASGNLPGTTSEPATSEPAAPAPGTTSGGVEGGLINSGGQPGQTWDASGNTWFWEGA